MKRSPIRQVSKARQKENRARAKILEETFGPKDTWRCILRDDPIALMSLGSCFGPVNGHELIKRSAGGSITDPGNIVLLCNGHNLAVEDHPKEAEKLGLAKRPRLRSRKYEWEVS